MIKHEVMDAYGNVVAMMSVPDGPVAVTNIPFDETVHDFIRTRERLLGVSAKSVFGSVVVKTVQIPFPHQRYRLRMRNADFIRIFIRFSPNHHEEWSLVEVGNIWVPGYKISVNKNSK